MINKFLINKSDEKNMVFIWNALASILNMGQSILLLMVIARGESTSDAGIFAIAYAIANLMIAIGFYGIRQYQSSDLLKKYTFKEYNVARIITCTVMIFVFLGYTQVQVFRGTYTVYKGIVVILISLARVVDAYEDVIHGCFQQQGYLETAAKIQVMRFLLYMFIYAIAYIFSQNLIIASASSLFISIIICVMLNTMAMRILNIEVGQCKACRVVQLLRECFPLFVSIFLSTYLGNAPKYAIDAVVSEQEQAQFNYVFMSIFAITLVSMFIYQPMITKYADYWLQGDMKAFFSSIKKQTLLLIIIILVSFLGAGFIGIPVLSWIFNVELESYKRQLLILVVGGGMLALGNYFKMLITVFREQNLLFIGYILASVVFVVLSKGIASKYQTIGISLLYTIILSGLTMFCFGIICIKYYEKIRVKEE